DDTKRGCDAGGGGREQGPARGSRGDGRDQIGPGWIRSLKGCRKAALHLFEGSFGAKRRLSAADASSGRQPPDFAQEAPPNEEDRNPASPVLPRPRDRIAGGRQGSPRQGQARTRRQEDDHL